MGFQFRLGGFVAVPISTYGCHRGIDRMDLYPSSLEYVPAVRVVLGRERGLPMANGS